MGIGVRNPEVNMVPNCLRNMGMDVRSHAVNPVPNWNYIRMTRRTGEPSIPTEILGHSTQDRAEGIGDGHGTQDTGVRT